MNSSTRPAHILPVIIFSQFTGTSLWFAGNAIILDLQRDWGLAEESLGYVTSAVHFPVTGAGAGYRPVDATPPAHQSAITQ